MGNFTLCEALTGGAFDSISCQHSGAFYHFFLGKSQMPGCLSPGGGGGAMGALDLTDTLLSFVA